MAKEYKISEEGLRALREELHFLKTVREREVANQIKEARSFGDLSENSEYDEAKNEQGKLYSRIAELENIIANHVIIVEQKGKLDQIRLGNNITVKDLDSGEEERYQIVGSQEASPLTGRISEESPFGRALLGKSVGDRVTVEAPAATIAYEILKIER